MRQHLDCENFHDENGNPAGGCVYGTGIVVDWQTGPMKLPEGEPIEQNGAFVEGVIMAAAQRLECYQNSRFKCPENAGALDHLNAALECLDSRTRDREAKGVEGTHGQRASEG